ncbi:MAG: two-component system sensor histidine kinase PhoQ [Alteromonadaceae bacterium]|jgi:two-component system sensor histidine kinase PhoQ
MVLLKRTVVKDINLNDLTNNGMSKYSKKIISLLPWQINSLKVRLIFSALFMIVVMLPIIGITLNNAFDKQLISAIKNELKAQSYSIFSVAEVENKQLLMPEQLLENQFNVIQSGLYALISIIPAPVIPNLAVSYSSKPYIKQTTVTDSSVLWKSRSLLALPLPSQLPTPEIGESFLSEQLLDGKIHLVYSFSASFNEQGEEFPITLHIIKDQSDFLTLASEFKQKLWTWLVVLMVLFIIVQVVWLVWTLKPLNKLTNELISIEKGEINYLQGIYPVELEQVTIQLNTLLSTEQNQRKRYRHALADLAHSLKTPLAVIQSQKELSLSSQEQLTAISRMIEHQLKRAQSAGESSWHLGIPVKAVAEKLVNTLKKIYQDKALDIRSEVSEQAIFKGDESDLMEILGNILDNACKAATSCIVLNIDVKNEQLRFMIADDGAGINQQQQKTIFERGVRADTYQQGHGIGLAIVRDLVASYHGHLQIQSSPELKGALFIITFKMSNTNLIN